MDEYNSGMDPEVKIYFRKIMKSLGAGLLWFFFLVTVGLFIGLAYVDGGLKWYNVVFYIVGLISLFFLLRYFRIVWGKEKKPSTDKD